MRCSRRNFTVRLVLSFEEFHFNLFKNLIIYDIIHNVLFTAMGNFHCFIKVFKINFVSVVML